MATDIDKLQIEINADSEKANNALDILCDKIGQLASSLGSLNGTKVKGIDNVQKQAKDAAEAMQPLTEKYKDLGKDFKFFGGYQAAQKKIESLSNAFETARMKKESLEVSGEIGGKMYDKAVRDFSMLGNQIENVKKQLEDLRTPKPVENFETHGLEEYKEEMSEVSEETKSVIVSTSSLKYDAEAMKIVFGEMADGIETYNQAIEKYGNQAGMILNDAFGSNMGTTELSSAAEKAKQLGELLSKLVVPEVREENLAKLESAISKTEQKLDSLRAKLANGLTMGTISDSIDDSGYVRLREQIALTEKSLEELQAKRAEVESTSGGNGLEKTEKKIRNVGTAAKYTYPKLLDMSGRIRGLTSSFSGGLKSLLKYTVGIRSLYVLFNKLRNGLKEGMKNLVQFSSETNTSVSLLYNSLNQLKNASAAAVSPLLNAVAPALNQIIQLFVNAANAVNQFLAALTGKSTWVKAKVLTDDYAASLESANKAAKNLTTLGIDELNINSGDTSSGSSGTSAGDMFEYEEVSQKWKDFADWFKSMWKDADFTELGEKIGEMLTNALNSIPWETVYEGARNFGKGLATFLNGLISPELFGAVGRTIARALNTAIYAALSFGETFDWVNLGESIAEGVNQFFVTFDFADLANTIDAWVQGIWKTIKTTIENIKWEDVWNGAKEFLENIDLETVGIVIGALTIKSILALHLGKTALSMIGTTLSRSIAQGIASKLGIEIAANAGIKTALQTGLTKAFSGIGTTFLAGLKGLFGNGAAESALAFINPITKAFTGIGTVIGGVALAATNFFSMWKDGFSWIKEALMVVGTALAAVGAVILGAPALVTGVVAAIVAAIGTIVAVVHDNWDSIASFFTETIPLFWEESIAPWFTAEKWSELGNGILEGIRTKWEELKDWWSNTALVLWWEEDVAPWFTAEKWSELYNSIKESLKTKWNEIVEWWKNTAIVKWWNEHVAPWFKKEKWTEIMSNVPTAFKETFKKAANVAIGIFNNLIDWINDKLHIEWEAVKILGETIIPAGSVQLFTIPHIPQFETGGFPKRYSLFMAGENGVPEIAGTVGGKTAVAGGAEITGIREAVIQTSNEEVQLLREQNELLRMLLEKDMSVNIGDREIVESYNRGRARMGYSFVQT